MPTYLGQLELTSLQASVLADTASEAHLNVHTIPDKPHHTTTGGLPHKQITTRKIKTDTAVVLENAAHGFKKANIMDVKLGTRLYADDASDEKKARFSKISEETTHKELGFRIAGMRVWQGHDVPRNEGDVDRHGFRIFDKNYGRAEVNAENVEEAFRTFIFSESAGVDQELGELICKAFVSELEELERELMAVETRMFSSSLLFVFEGDGEALRRAMEDASSSPVENGMNGTNGHAADSEAPAADVTDLLPDAEDDADSDSESGAMEPRIYGVKLIDFAHATYTPGQGPDENTLKGIRSVIKILRSLSGDLCAQIQDDAAYPTPESASIA
jgi:1D-myo-inositol-tetrakisphosphate 5-kinase/inositol-polyphosphate multikinase